MAENNHHIVATNDITVTSEQKAQVVQHTERVQLPTVGQMAEQLQLFSCPYDCGPKRPLSSMIQANPKQNPVCKPCYNAVRALRQHAGRDAENKNLLDKLKQADPAMFRAKVRACRVVDPAMGDSETSPGVSNMGDRRFELVNVFKSLRQSAGVKEVSGVEWLSKEQFIRWAVQEYHADDAGKALVLWNRRCKDPNVHKREAQGDCMRQAVAMTPRTEVYRCRETYQEISRTSSIENIRQGECAMKELCAMGDDGVLGMPCMQGMTSGLLPGDSLGSGALQMGQFPSMPNASTAVPTEYWDSLGPAYKATKRKLGLQASDTPDEQPKKKRTSGATALAGAAGELLSLRKQGIEFCELVVKEYCTKAKDRSSKLAREAILSKTTLSKGQQEMISVYQKLMGVVKKEQKDIKDWTLADAVERLGELQNSEKHLEMLSTELDKHCEEVKKNRTSANKLAAAERTKHIKQRVSDTAPYKSSPAVSLVRFLWEKRVLMLAEHEQTVDEEADTQAQQDLCTDNCPTVSAEEDSFKLEAPCLLRAGQAGNLGESVTQMVESLGRERLKTEEDLLVERMVTGRVPLLQKYIAPKGTPKDSIEQLSWVPQFMQSKQVKPEAMRELGVPTLHVSSAGAVRHLSEHWAVSGMGQMVSCLSGSAVFFAYPVSSAVNLGASLDRAGEFLFEEMQYQQFTSWAERHMKWATVRQGSSFWLPYGYFSGMVSLTGRASWSSFLAVPFVNVKLAQIPSWPAISQDLANHITRMMKQRPVNKFWERAGESALEWLKESTAEASAPPGPLALEYEDGADEKDDEDQQEEQGPPKKPTSPSEPIGSPSESPSREIQPGDTPKSKAKKTSNEENTPKQPKRGVPK